MVPRKSPLDTGRSRLRSVLVLAGRGLLTLCMAAALFAMLNRVWAAGVTSGESWWSSAGPSATGFDTPTPTVTPTITPTPSRTPTATATPCTLQTFASSDVPKTICDLCQNIISTLSVSGAGTVQDVDMRALNITHTFIGDLIITVTNPSGINVRILDRQCGNTQNI